MRSVLLLLAAGLTLGGCFASSPVSDPPPVDLCPENARLALTDLVPGTGPREVRPTDTVVIAYTGRLLDSSVFDQSDRFEVDLARAIAGLREGMLGMRVGGRRQIMVPPNLGYAMIPQAQIPACSTLVLDVTLLEVR